MFDEFGVSYKRVVLDNGAEVRSLHKVGAPIHIQACIHAGSRYNHIPGLAHFCEHMLLAGTASYPTKHSIAKTLESVGGTFEATTDADLLRFTVSIPSINNFAFAVSILEEILTKAMLLEDAIENERSAILSEQKDKKNDSNYILQYSLMSLMYPDHGLHFHNLGTADSVTSIQRQDIVQFVNEYISSNRIHFIVSGGVDMETACEALRKIPLPVGTEIGVQTVPPIPDNKRVSIQHKLDTQARIAVGFRCDTTTVEELAALILVQQLATGRSNPFITALRYEHGLVYGGKTLLWDFNGTNVFSISTSCAPENVEKVHAIIDKILHNVFQSGISEEVCRQVQIKADSYYRFNLQTSKQWLDAEATAVRHSIEGEKGSHALTALQYVQDLNATRLTELFKTFFDPQQAYCSVLGELPNQTVENLLTR
jgi:predicted Zn-dependent peptidase